MCFEITKVIYYKMSGAQLDAHVLTLPAMDVGNAGCAP